MRPPLTVKWPLGVLGGKAELGEEAADSGQSRGAPLASPWELGALEGGGGVDPGRQGGCEAERC